MDAPVERPKSLTEIATQRLRRDIVSGRHAFGAHLSEATLAAFLGISKTPVREALLRLRAEGLVEIHPQRGTFVFALDEEGVAQLCHFREIVETAALGEAMRHSRQALLERLQANVDAMGRAHVARDLKSLPALDQAFHETLLDCCGNAYLQAAYQLVAHKINALRSRLPEDNERVGHCQDNHARIVDAIRRGNAARSRALLSEHIRDTLESYLGASRS
jgi:DNA-binding GntR family transcriptional regulator